MAKNSFVAEVTFKLFLNSIIIDLSYDLNKYILYKQV